MMSIEETLAIAERHVREHRHEAAEEAYRAVLEREPLNGEALTGFGTLLLKRGDEGAFEILARATSAAPDNARAYHNLGVAYVVRTDHDRAATCFETALSVDPDHHEARLALADTALARGDPEAAFAAVGEVLARAPDHAAALAAAGRIKALLQDIPAAIALFERALAARPDDPAVLTNLSTACAAAGQDERAAELAERAWLLSPLDPSCGEACALRLLAVGSLDRAATVIERVATLHPRLPSVAIAAARIRQASGKGREAIASLATLLKQAPRDPELTPALARLLLEEGRYDEAARIAASVLAVEGAAEAAREALWKAHAAAGRFEDLAGCFEGLADADPASLAVAVDGSATPLETLALLRFLPGFLAVPRATMTLAPWAVPLVERLAFPLAPAPPTDPPAVRPVPPRALPALAPPAPDALGEAIPYLLADPEATVRWREALSGFPRPLIGFTWSRRPPGATVEDLRDALLARGGTPVSLVWDETRHQLSRFREAIDAGVHLSGAAEAIDVVACLDAVVAADGLPLHFAGALGKPAVALAGPALPFYLALRDEGGRSRWYPSMTVVQRADRETPWAEALTGPLAALAPDST